MKQSVGWKTKEKKEKKEKKKQLEVARKELPAIPKERMQSMIQAIGADQHMKEETIVGKKAQKSEKKVGKKRLRNNGKT